VAFRPKKKTTKSMKIIFLSGNYLRLATAVFFAVRSQKKTARLRGASACGESAATNVAVEIQRSRSDTSLHIHR